MNTDQALPLLGNLSPDQFMRRHWQRKPLLVRQAIPGFKPLLSRVHSMQELTELLPITGGERLTRQPTRGQASPYAPESSASLAQPNWELGADEFGLLLDNP